MSCTTQQQTGGAGRGGGREGGEEGEEEEEEGEEGIEGEENSPNVQVKSSSAAGPTMPEHSFT